MDRSVAEAMRQEFPEHNIALHVLPRAGHHVNVDNPDDFHRAVFSVLDDPRTYAPPHDDQPHQHAHTTAPAEVSADLEELVLRQPE